MHDRDKQECQSCDAETKGFVPRKQSAINTAPRWILSALLAIVWDTQQEFEAFTVIYINWAMIFHFTPMTYKHACLFPDLRKTWPQKMIIWHWLFWMWRTKRYWIRTRNTSLAVAPAGQSICAGGINGENIKCERSGKRMMLINLDLG